jgi:crossover junction endodeoxyribonuclease RuvC
MGADKMTSIHNPTVGIDPGLSGAIAIYRPDEAPMLFDMPTCARLSGKGAQLDLAHLTAILAGDERMWDSRNPPTVFLEQVGAMPGQGVTSMFSFGRSVGQVEGILGALQMPVRYLSPRSWKKTLGLIGKDKDAARTLAIQRFPLAAGDLKRKKDCGRADALLMAYVGWSMLTAEGRIAA